MVNRIGKLIDGAGLNPHLISTRTGITYRIVLNLYKAKAIRPTTPIGTLQGIASVLGVKVDDLYEVKTKA